MNRFLLTLIMITVALGAPFQQNAAARRAVFQQGMIKGVVIERDRANGNPSIGLTIFDTRRDKSKPIDKVEVKLPFKVKCEVGFKEDQVKVKINQGKMTVKFDTKTSGKSEVPLKEYLPENIPFFDPGKAKDGEKNNGANEISSGGYESGGYGLDTLANIRLDCSIEDEYKITKSLRKPFVIKAYYRGKKVSTDKVTAKKLSAVGSSQSILRLPRDLLAGEEFTGTIKDDVEKWVRDSYKQMVKQTPFLTPGDILVKKTRNSAFSKRAQFLWGHPELGTGYPPVDYKKLLGEMYGRLVIPNGGHTTLSFGKGAGPRGKRRHNVFDVVLDSVAIGDEQLKRASKVKDFTGMTKEELREFVKAILWVPVEIFGPGENGDGSKFRAKLPNGIRPGTKIIDVIYYDRYGEKTSVKTSTDFVEDLPTVVADPGNCKYEIKKTARYGFAGQTLCACGCFAANSDFYLDDEKTSLPFGAASHTTVTFNLGKGLSAGEHTIRYVPQILDKKSKKLSYGKATFVKFTLLRVNGSIDRSKLWTGQSTNMRLQILGTGDKLPVLIKNKTPKVISMTGGNNQATTSSGGAANVITRGVTGVHRGNFSIVYRLNTPRCPCRNAGLPKDLE